MNGKERFNTRTKMLLYFLEGSKRYFVASILFACLVSVLDLINPKIISYTVDSILDSQNVVLPDFLNSWIDSIGGAAYLRANLWLIALAVLIVAAMGALCRFLFNLFNSIGAEHLVGQCATVCLIIFCIFRLPGTVKITPGISSRDALRMLNRSRCSYQNS